MPRLTPLPRDAFDFAAARHLLVRAGFGGTPGMVQGLLSKGLDEAVDWLVDFEGESATGPDRIVQADTFDPRIKMQLTAADSPFRTSDGPTRMSRSWSSHSST